MTGQPEPVYVVVLTHPDGRRHLSHSSLMYQDEAEHEAGQWRHSSTGAGKWQADVQKVAA